MIESLMPENEETAVHQLQDATADVAQVLGEGGDLSLSSRKLETLFADNRECIYLKDREQRIVFSNESFNQLCAAKLPSPIGLKSSSFLASELVEISCNSDAMILGGCRRLKFHHTVNITDEGPVETITVKLSLLGTQGEVQGILGLSRPLRRMTEKLSRQTLERLAAVVDDLRPEELQVAKLVCDGVPNKKIAEIIDSPLRTVENRRRNLLKKLQLDTTAELIKLLVRLEDAGLVKLGV